MIREPVDWLGSWYRYRSRPGFDHARKSTQGVSFAEFVEGYLTSPSPSLPRSAGASRFVVGKSGKPAVTHMFRYENIPGMVRFLEERFGREIRLPKVNVSPKGNLELPSALRTRLETERAEDFAIYADHAR